MKPIIAMLAFGIPAVIALLAVGGDLTRSESVEPPQVPEDSYYETAEPAAGAGELPIRQKILNWEYRHFDPGLGVFDWYARGTEGVRQEENEFDVTKPEVLFSSFTKTTPLLKKTLTKLNAGRGRINFGKENVSAFLKQEVVISNLDLFTPEGLSEVKLYADEFNVLAANRREGREVPAADFWSDSVVHVTGPSFEVFGRGGMRGATELNRMSLKPPIAMHLVTGEEGLFFGRKREGVQSKRRVDVEGEGPLLVERVPEQGVFIMSLTGGVIVTDGDISVRSDRLGVALGQSRSVEKASAEGGIEVRQAGEPRLFGEKAVWDVESGKTVVTGRMGVRFVEGKNSLFARSATLLDDRKRLMLEGGVEAHLEAAQAEQEGKKSFPRLWKVTCDKAEVLLADEGGSMKAQQVLLIPARGRMVKVQSIDGAYVITGGLVVWDAANETIEFGDKPEFEKSQTERVQSQKAVLLLKEGMAVFEGEVIAQLAAGDAKWEFRAARMAAEFTTPLSGTPEMESVTLTDPGKRVRAVYTPRDGSEIRLTSDRIAWEAATGVAVLDSENANRLQRLERGRDWVEAKALQFRPGEKKAVFTEDVRAHLEDLPVKSEGSGDIAEPPFEMASDRLTVLFDDQYNAKEALAEGSVRFAGSSGGLTLECERARHVRGDVVSFEGKKRPELVSEKNKLSADRILVYLHIGRIVFMDKVVGGFDSGEGAVMIASCDKMIALYKRPSGEIKEVYFEDNVHVEAMSKAEGTTTADGERAVYEVEKARISVAGTPVTVKQPAMVIREEKVVYDLKERILLTKPGEKGYDWDVDPSGWKK